MLRALRISLPAASRAAATSHSVHASSALRALAITASNIPARSYASIAPVPSSSTSSESILQAKPTQVEVNPNHGLYAFFRKRVETTGEGETQETKVTYESIEVPDANFGGMSYTLTTLTPVRLTRQFCRTCLERL
jgi:hypothetical protein